MQELSDSELLHEYAHRNRDEAFAVIVARHVNVVYSVALRKTGNAHAAQEITQAVFILLAKKATTLRKHTALSGWLYQAARLTAANYLRTEIRRARREKEACLESSANETVPEPWPQIAPLLEDAMGRLGERERDAITMRFFEGKSFQEIGTASGASENTAKKRVQHGIEKLRRHFVRRGVTLSGAVLAATISANSVHAAPAGLVSSVTTAALAKGATAGLSTVALMKGAWNAMVWAKYKFTLGLAAGVLTLGGTITLAVVEEHLQTKTPDPVALLQRVAAARNKIKSGTMEFEVARHDSYYAIRTNYSLLKVVFDGEKRHFEQLGRESYIVSMAPDAGTVVDAKRKELNGDDEALAALGLIKFEDAHYRTIYDGKALMRYDPRLDTEIRDPKEGSFTYAFDPRTLGLSDAFFPSGTVENSLEYKKAQTVSLVGKESVDDHPAWHVRVEMADKWQYDFWLDAKYPTHVLKQEAPNRGGMAFSKFDDAHPEDPLPVELHLVENRRTFSWESWMVRKNTRYNVPIEGKAWTLAGLCMPAGTPVVDARIHKRIGYWTGSKLPDKFPDDTVQWLKELFHGANPQLSENPPRHAVQQRVGYTMENSLDSLSHAATDGSFVNERKILLRRGMWLVLLILFLPVIWKLRRRVRNSR